MSFSASNEDKKIGFFEGKAGKTIKAKNAPLPKPKEAQREKEISYLGGNITIKNMNNISIENIMLNSSLIESKQKYEPVLMTEPAVDDRMKLSEKKLVKGLLRNQASSKEKDSQQRASSRGNKRVNKMITNLRDEFNEITQKNRIQRQDTVEHCVNNSDEENEGEHSICSINSFIESKQEKKKKKSNLKYINNTKPNIRTSLLLGKNDTGILFKPHIVSPQKITLFPSKPTHKHRNNRNNSALKSSFMKTYSFGTNALLTSQQACALIEHNASCSNNFNCINKQIAFSIRSTRREAHQEKEQLILKQQGKIKELLVSISILKEFIASQQNVFLNHCKEVIASQVLKTENYLLIKEREMNAHLIKENKLFKQLIQTIISQICKVIRSESLQFNKDNAVISRVLKENEYLRQMNSSVSNLLIQSPMSKDKYHDVNRDRSRYPSKKKSSSNCKRMRNENPSFIAENESKSRNLLSLSSVVNKNLEETIKKLAECKSINEIAKISSTSSSKPK